MARPRRHFDHPEARLEHVRRERVRGGEVGARRVDVALAQLEHAEVGVRLGVVGVLRDGDLEGLVREAEVADADGHLLHNMESRARRGQRQAWVWPTTECAPLFELPRVTHLSDVVPHLSHGVVGG